MSLRRGDQRRRSPGVLVTTLALGAIALATLVPDGSGVATAARLCLFCGERPVADAIVNVLLFSPLGVGLALLGSGRAPAVLAGTMLSCVIELVQLLLPGRDPNLGDVAANAAGVAAGFALVGVVRSASHHQHWAPRLGVAAAVVLTFIVAGSGWLLSPQLPPSTYWGQWTPTRIHLTPYGGHVTGAMVGSQPVPSYRMSASADARSAILAGAPITITARAGPPPPRLAPLFAIADEQGRLIVQVGVDGADLSFTHRARASQFGVYQPDLRFRGAMTGVVAGEEVRVRVRREGRGRWCMAVNDRTACGLGVSAARAWELLHRSDTIPFRTRNLLDALWMALLVFPVALAFRPRPSGALALTLAFAALGPVAHWVGLVSPGVAGGAGVALGFCGGLALGHFRGRRGPNAGD